ncbi:MAG: carboxypeptidase-like regulatory domain-containing protein [Anaerolineales bacterium]|nr:carboxypeptidase-like regulatory domain-containing protein [Anaerolineales bacterium]
MGRSWLTLLNSAFLIASWLIGLFAPWGAAPARAIWTENLPQTPDTTSRIEGTVSSLGYCDANPFVLEGAEVTLETSQGLIATEYTDETGFYQFAIELESGTTALIDITVHAQDYEVGIAESIVLGAGEIAVQDFDLRWLKSCTSSVPDSLEVSVEAGHLAVLSFRLKNAGEVNTNYTITEQTGTFLPFTNEAGLEVMIGDGAWGVSDMPAGLTASPALNRPDNELIVTQSLSQAIVAGNSISCNTDFYHAENSYLRVFELADYGINYDFAVSRVEIGIEKAVGSQGSQPAIVNIYTIGDDLNWDNLILLSSIDFTVQDTTLSLLSIPISAQVPVGSILVVEFLTPEGRIEGNSLFVGSNPEGQTGATYLAAPDCDYPDPTPTELIGFPDMHMVMNVYGDISLEDPGEVAWVKETPLTGLVPAGGSADIDVIFTPDHALTAGTYTSNLQVVTDDPQNNPLLIPITMHIIEYDLEITAAELELSGTLGSKVIYNVTVTNTSQGVIDRFDLSVLDAEYLTTLTSTSTPDLEPGEAFTFQVEVIVGSASQYVSSDAIQVLAQFHTRPLYQADITLITELLAGDLFLPLVMRKN